jgi:ribonuclease HI
MSEQKVIVYTDGGCRGNPGPGGWGAVLKFGEHEKEIYGYEAETTNNAWS